MNDTTGLGHHTDSDRHEPEPFARSWAAIEGVLADLRARQVGSRPGLADVDAGKQQDEPVEPNRDGHLDADQITAGRISINSPSGWGPASLAVITQLLRWRAMDACPQDDQSAAGDDPVTAAATHEIPDQPADSDTAAATQDDQRSSAALRKQALRGDARALDVMLRDRRDLHALHRTLAQRAGGLDVAEVTTTHGLRLRAEATGEAYQTIVQLDDPAGRNDVLASGSVEAGSAIAALKMAAQREHAIQGLDHTDMRLLGRQIDRLEQLMLLDGETTTHADERGDPSTAAEFNAIGEGNNVLDLAQAASGRDLGHDPGVATLATVLRNAEDAGWDLAANLPRLTVHWPLDDQHPAHDLAYRVMTACPDAVPEATISAPADDAGRQLAVEPAHRPNRRSPKRLDPKMATASVAERWRPTQAGPVDPTRVAAPAVATEHPSEGRHVISSGTTCASAGARQRFDIDGRLVESTANAAAQQILAVAHADRTRPLCLCSTGGAPMCVARVGQGRFIVKRMPDTGMLHAPNCPSYLALRTTSHLGQFLGDAIREQPDTGIVALRLGFHVSRTDGGALTGTAGSHGRSRDSGQAARTRLGMRAVLHYLWHEAGLDRWTPAMAGKRNWRVVSWHLRHAAEGKYVKGKPLLQRLFVPEPFTAEHKAELAARRLAAWAPVRGFGRTSQLMILIGEVKAVESARSEHRLVIKHLPDAPLMLDEDLHRRTLHRFADELEMRQADVHGHLMVIATFSVGRAGLANVQEISLAMTDEHWLPYESTTDKTLLDAVIAARRRFTKCLRYNLTADHPSPSLMLTDTLRPTAAYVVSSPAEPSDVEMLRAGTGLDTWIWTVGELMPPLPVVRSAKHASH